MKKIIALLPVCIYTMQVFAQGTFIIPSGTTVKTTGSAYIVLTDMNFQNNSTFAQAFGDGTVQFSGSTSVTLSGIGSTTFDHLLLSKGGGSMLTLQSNISIVNEINFSAGLLNLGNSIVDLGSTGVLNNESETNRPYTIGSGYIQVSSNLNAPSSVNVGNTGAIISSAANLGNTVVRRGFLPQTNFYGNGSSILRYYVITPTNNTALNATLRFQYLDAELNGLTEASLVLWKSPDNVRWTNQGFDSRNTTSNFVEKTGISDFSTWTLSSPTNALPVTLVALNARQKDSYVEISWQVLTETNVDRYDIERSIDGVNFVRIGTVRAVGIADYSGIDNHPSGGRNFYRLKIQDKDGSIRLSRVLRVNIDNNIRSIGFFPNPAIDHLITVQFTNISKGRYTFNVINNAGQNVYSRLIDHDGGSASRVIYLPVSLLQGVYTVLVSNSETKFKDLLIIK